MSQEQENRLMNETLKGLADQSMLADEIVQLLIEDPSYVSAHPLLSLAVFKYMALRTQLNSLGDRIKGELGPEAVEKLDQEWKDLEDEGKDS